MLLEVRENFFCEPAGDLRVIILSIRGGPKKSPIHPQYNHDKHHHFGWCESRQHRLARDPNEHLAAVYLYIPAKTATHLR